MSEIFLVKHQLLLNISNYERNILKTNIYRRIEYYCSAKKLSLQIYINVMKYSYNKHGVFIYNQNCIIHC